MKRPSKFTVILISVVVCVFLVFVIVSPNHNKMSLGPVSLETNMAKDSNSVDKIIDKGTNIHDVHGNVTVDNSQTNIVNGDNDKIKKNK